MNDMTAASGLTWLGRDFLHCNHKILPRAERSCVKSHEQLLLEFPLVTFQDLPMIFSCLDGILWLC